MLRGMGRVLCCFPGRRARQLRQPMLCATDSSGSGMSGWREHGREDSPSCTARTLPI